MNENTPIRYSVPSIAEAKTPKKNFTSGLGAGIDSEVGEENMGGIKEFGVIVVGNSPGSSTIWIVA